MPTGVVLPDGRSLVFSQSRDENVATLNAVSPGDGDAYRAAMAVHAAVAPAVNARWMLQELPRPVPGPNQVLIRIHASGICFTDVHQTHCRLPGAFPRVLGHEPVGEIVELGPGVVTRKVGDRVGVPWVQTTDGRCEWCLRGRPMFCPNAISTGTQAQGGHAEFMPAYASATMLIPDSVSYEQAAPIFCAGYTVWSGLRWADFVAKGKVKVIAETYKLDEINRAYDRVETGKARFRAVVVQ